MFLLSCQYLLDLHVSYMAINLYPEWLYILTLNHFLVWVFSLFFEHEMWFSGLFFHCFILLKSVLYRLPLVLLHFYTSDVHCIYGILSLQILNNLFVFTTLLTNIILSRYMCTGTCICFYKNIDIVLNILFLLYICL